MSSHESPEKGTSILSMPYSELVTSIGGSGRAKIIWDRLRQGQNPLDKDSTYLSEKAKGFLQDIIGHSTLISNDIISETPSTCGTRKFLQKLPDGKMGLIRNLTADEILSQVFHGLSVSIREKMPQMTNIVFMGMGD
eukprot:gene3241-4265_t